MQAESGKHGIICIAYGCQEEVMFCRARAGVRYFFLGGAAFWGNFVNSCEVDTPIVICYDRKSAICTRCEPGMVQRAFYAALRVIYSVAVI